MIKSYVPNYQIISTRLLNQEVRDV